jgi:hypothetical protein
MPPRLYVMVFLSILKWFMMCAHRLGVGQNRLQLTTRMPTWLGLMPVFSSRSLQAHRIRDT